MKILFAFYPLFVRYNHGIALLSALCKERGGIETALYVLDTVEEFRRYISKNDFDYISFSVVTKHDFEQCLPFMEAAKKNGNTVLLGGVYIRRELPKHVPADYVCRGEGETLPDFLLNGDDRLFREKMTCSDLNSLPLPDYELFKDTPFNRKIPFLDGKRVLPYYSSRGCPHKCSFCEVRGQTGIVRFRYKVQEDCNYLAEKYKPDIFFMGDELLPYYNEAWRNSWKDFTHPFAAYIRADITEIELRWLADRGLCGCAFGIESGDEKYRNDILKKDLSDADIFRTVDLLQKLGIQYAPFYMTDTPEETFSIKAKTYHMAESLGGHPFIWQYEELFKKE